MKLVLWLFAIPVFAGPCLLQLPGEDYTSTDCGHFNDTSYPGVRIVSVEGEWVPDPTDYVYVDWVCVENEDYYVGGVPEYKHYDGAPPCGNVPVLLTPPSVYTPPPTEPTPVPEPGTWTMVLVVALGLAFRALFTRLRG